ncbi:MAG: right-handed parallel beta-helix repeat-containing protein [Candidatus Hodarchaeota archaeon]
MKTKKQIGLLVLGSIGMMVMLSLLTPLVVNEPLNLRDNPTTIPCQIFTSGPQIVIMNDTEMDTYFASNATNGTSHNDAYLLENITFTSVNNDVIIKIYDTMRFLHINNCTFTNEGNAFSTSRGILLDNASNIVIENCRFIGFNPNGLVLTKSTNITINSSDFKLNSYGINLNNLNAFVNISKNRFYNNSRGLNSYMNSYIQLEQNFFYGNYMAVRMDLDDFYDIFDNTFYSNKNGLMIYEDCIMNYISNNYFVKNIPFQNTDWDSDTPSDNINFWDNSSWGNYWSNYQSRYPSATHNGTIWDIPYEVTQAGYQTPVYDDYPLVACTFPFVDFIADQQTIQVNKTVSFQFTGVLGFGNPSFNWSFGDGTYSNSTNPTHVYSEVGTYDITLTLEDADGDVRTFTLEDYIQVTIGGTGLPPLQLILIITGSAVAGVLIIVAFLLKSRIRED